MDDIMGKIQEVLSDEESMKMINELASSMFSGGDENEPESSQEQSGENNNTADDSGINFGNMMAIMSLLGSAENDKNAELLLALKPLLREERQARVDRAVKMLKLYSVWTILKDSGMLNDII